MRRRHDVLLVAHEVGCSFGRRRAVGDFLAFSPPLVITEDELAETAHRFARGLERLERALGACREASG